MLKLYNTICGITGILEGTSIIDTEFEYQGCLLDLAEVNAVYPHLYGVVISNVAEFNKRRDDAWRGENSNPEPGMHPPSVMTTLMPSCKSCVAVQIGTQVFYFDEDTKTMFDLVCDERSS